MVNLYLIFIDLIKILIVVDLNVDIYSFKSEAEEGDLNLDILWFNLNLSWRGCTSLQQGPMVVHIKTIHLQDFLVDFEI